MKWYAIRRLDLTPGSEDTVVQIVRCRDDEIATCIHFWDQTTGMTHYSSVLSEDSE